MEREEFVVKLSERVNLDLSTVDAVVNATLAEMLAPTIFGRPEDRLAIFDNNCNNNCKEEIARVSAVRR